MSLGSRNSPAGLLTESVTKTTFTETTVQRVTKQAVVEEVALLRSGGPLGLSIIGGSDHSCIPFGTGEQGIYISKIIAGGAAAATGKLRMGDRVLAVNTTDIKIVTHQEAVMALLQHCQVMKLTVQHDPLPSGFQEISVVKQPGEKLGMIIKGGLRGQPGNPLDPADEGVFCVKVNPGSRASIESGIEVGQRIIEVNGQSLLGATHQEAVAILRNAGDEIKLLVCDGFNPASVPNIGSESQETSQLDLHPLVPPVLAHHSSNGDPQVRLAEPPSSELPEDLDKSNTSSSTDEEFANQTVIITSSLPEQDELLATPSSQVSPQSPQPIATVGRHHPLRLPQRSSTLL
jgi:protein scribble